MFSVISTVFSSLTSDENAYGTGSSFYCQYSSQLTSPNNSQGKHCSNNTKVTLKQRIGRKRGTGMESVIVPFATTDSTVTPIPSPSSLQGFESSSQ
jgi:hypothetical protein